MGPSETKRVSKNSSQGALSGEGPFWGVLTPSQWDVCRDLEGGSRAEDKPPPEEEASPLARPSESRCKWPNARHSRVPWVCSPASGPPSPDGFSASLPRRLLLLSPLSAPTGASLSQSRARAQGGTLHPPQELC